MSQIMELMIRAAFALALWRRMEIKAAAVLPVEEVYRELELKFVRVNAVLVVADVLAEVLQSQQQLRLLPPPPQQLGAIMLVIVPDEEIPITIITTVTVINFTPVGTKVMTRRRRGYCGTN